MIEVVKLTINTPRLPGSSVDSFVTQRTGISFAGLGASVAIYTVRRL
jgi:hypothetical protein